MSFDHRQRTWKHFENLLGFCVCETCSKLPEHEVHEATKTPMKSTRTYAILEISPTAYAEIRGKLAAAGYGHAFLDDEIDMHGIALKALPHDQEARPADSDDEARAARIRQARFERGKMDAQMGEPPTEASSEYQKGYASAPRVP